MPKDRHSRSISPHKHSEHRHGPHTRRETERVEAKERPRRSRSRSRSPDRRSRSRSPSRKKRRTSYSRPRSTSKDRGRKDHSRSRSRSLDRKGKEKRRRDRSVSTSSDSDDSRSKRRKDRKREKERSGSKERRREKKREKKEKKDKKKRGGNSSHWGKYGIISDIDIFNKTSEFQTWLVEERKVNPETVSKDQQKKEFSKFVEDYNTATLPHEKYYNMDAYERRMAALRQGEYLPPAEDTYDPEADMKAIVGAHKKKPVERETYMSREQLIELRKVQQERIEVGKMKLLGMDIKQNMGVRMDGTVFDD